MFRKLDLPKPSLPRTLYDPADLKFKSQEHVGYESYNVYPEVHEHIKSLFPVDFFKPEDVTVFQLMVPSLNGVIHKDHHRIAVINYTLDPGGKYSFTSIYDDDRNEIGNFRQETGEWYFLRTDCNHAVRDVGTRREALSISFYTFSDEQMAWIDKVSAE